MDRVLLVRKRAPVASIDDEDCEGEAWKEE